MTLARLLHNRVRLASNALPCIDTRTAYWRYYLFAAPSTTGRPISVGPRLLSILR
jgi:hypothetical protein